MEDEIYKEHEQSEFNFGIATLQRLHELKKWLDFTTTTDDPQKQLQYLRAFYKELHPLMTDEKKDHEKNWDKSFEVEKRILKNEHTQNDIKFLNDWEISLRQMDQDKGLNMPKKKDARFALARR